MPDTPEVPPLGAMNSTQLLEYMGTDAWKWTEQFLLHTDLANAGPVFSSLVNAL